MYDSICCVVRQKKKKSGKIKEARSVINSY